MPTVLQAEQYVARNADNTPKDPQPGDVEITDAFGNVFDNFNADWVDYDKDNVAVNPQPAYQNLDYVARNANNTATTPAFEPDAAQWIARGVDNQVRTPQPYVRSPLFPDGVPATISYTPHTFEIVLRVEESEGMIVTEDDINTIELTLSASQIASIPAVANYK